MLNAVKVMYVGAAASLLGIIIDIVTVSATKTAIEKRSPNLSVSQVNSSQHVLVAGFIAGGVIAAVVWIVLARASKAGHNWARITGTVLFALSTVDTIVGLTAPIAAPGQDLGRPRLAGRADRDRVPLAAQFHRFLQKNAVMSSAVMSSAVISGAGTDRGGPG